MEKTMSVTTPVHTARARRRMHRQDLGAVVSWLYLTGAVLITLFPFFWMVRTALSNNYALSSDPSSLLPVDFTWGAFERVLGLQSAEEARAQGGTGAQIDALLFMRNSVVYAGISTALQISATTLAAYAFSRLQWRGRDLVFNIFFTALMIPGIVLLLPNYVTIRDLGLLDSFAGLILPGALFSAYNVFFLRQFFLGLSSEMEEAALIDGAGRLRILFQITLPLASGPLTMLTILGFVYHWNDYLWPLVVTRSDSVKPLNLALGVFRSWSPGAAPDWAGLMAAAVVTALPMILVFIVFGRRIVNSIGFSGVK